jgi:hypothetical protein
MIPGDFYERVKSAREDELAKGQVAETQHSP